MRDQFIVATKGAHPELATMRISRLSPPEIASDIEESLAALEIDAIDLYWLHRDDPAVPVGEILVALNEHLAAGRLRAIGASNWSAERLEEAADYARAHGLTGFCASSVGWSLAVMNPAAMVYGTLSMDERTRAYHRQTQMPVVAYTSQAQGFFSGKYHTEDSQSREKLESNIGRLFFSPENFARLAQAEELAARRGWTANQIALAYLLSQPFPVYPIVGCRTPAQVQASCAAAGFRLRPEEAAFLEGHPEDPQS